MVAPPTPNIPESVPPAAPTNTAHPGAGCCSPAFAVLFAPHLENQVDRHRGDEQSERHSQRRCEQSDREFRRDVGDCNRARREYDGIADIHAAALVVAPKPEHHVRHHHDQGGPLRQMLVHAEHQRQDGNGDDSPADAEQAAEETEQGPERQIEKNLQQMDCSGSRGLHSIPASPHPACSDAGPAISGSGFPGVPDTHAETKTGTAAPVSFCPDRSVHYAGCMTNNSCICPFAFAIECARTSAPIARPEARTTSTSVTPMKLSTCFR